MKILSLDLSSKASGWCVGTEDKIIDYGCFEVKGKNPYRRIIEMRDFIIKLIIEQKINTIVIEEVPVDDFQNTHTYKILTYLQGVIVVGLEENSVDVNIEFIQSSSWREKLGIKTGRGIRREMLKPKDIAYVNNKYNLNIESDDIADAICLKDAYFIIQQEKSKKEAPPERMGW